MAASVDVQRRLLHDEIVRLSARGSLFSDAGGTPYFFDGGVAYGVGSGRLAHCLRTFIQKKKEVIPSDHVIREGVALAAALALERREQVHVRVAHEERRLFIDMVDGKKGIVEVDGEGWRVRSALDPSPVKFVRGEQARALRAPEKGGSIEELREFVRLENKDDFVLFVGWILSALMPDGPFPVLSLSGPAGAGKSVATEVAVSLIDPNSAVKAAPPASVKDLIVRACTSYILSFDNVSGVGGWMSDALCQLATGGALVSRQLYTDSGQVVLAFKRPCVINGIPDIVGREDLAERQIPIALAPAGRFRSERELWRRFEEAKGRLLGVLLDGVAAALRDRETPRPSSEAAHRMVDVEEWVGSAITAWGWDEGAFREAYERRREDMLASRLECSALVGALVDLVEQMEREEKWQWEGTCKGLLSALEFYRPEWARPPIWPGTPRALRGAINRERALLSMAGIEVSMLDGIRCGPTRAKAVVVMRKPSVAAIGPQLKRVK